MLVFVFQFQLYVILMIEETILVISLQEAMIHSVLLEVQELQFLTKGFGKYLLWLRAAKEEF